MIVNFKTQIEGFNHHEKKLLRNGRYNKFYEELSECVFKKGSKKGEKESCLKESIHKECLSDFMEFKQCIDTKKVKNDCNVNLGEYFICVDGSIKQILLSSTLSYWSSQAYIINAS